MKGKKIKYLTSIIVSIVFWISIAMQRRHNTLIVIIVIILGRIAQIIFSLLYNPQQSHHAGLTLSGRSDHFIQSGYVQLIIEDSTTHPPHIIDTTTSTTKYTDQCLYGSGVCTWLWKQNTLAGRQWLEAIQYIGKYVNPAQPSSVSNRIYDIVQLAPQRVYPYIFANIVAPTTKTDPATSGAILTRDNTAIIGEMGISQTCDSEKIAAIAKLDYKSFIEAIQRKDSKLRNPCSDYRLPHHLAFNYFQYLHDHDKASLYYMVASFHDDVPSITVAMPAIIRGQVGDNFTSASLRYDRYHNVLAQYKQLEDKNSDEAKELEKLITNSMNKSIGEISMWLLSTSYPEG